MDRLPLVSVITPTWQRHDLLTGRCMPSVAAAAAAWPQVEHVIVSDGPDPKLAALLCGMFDPPPDAVRRPCLMPRAAYVELPAHEPARHWGHLARLAGIAVARGDVIAYLDDDDAYRPGHLAVLAGALARTGADFAYGQMVSHASAEMTIGVPLPCPGQIGTPMIVHRRDLLDVATWGPADPMEDWQLVERWMAGGARWEFVPEPTVDVWPSEIHHH